MEEIKEAAKELLEVINQHKRIFVLTGAGISTPSGIPDFRGKGGLYERLTPEVFDISFFYRNPEFFYSSIGPFLKVILEAKPNPAHYLISRLEKIGKLLLVATQNIDGLHQKAGTTKIAELHGSLERAHCLKCGREYVREHIMDRALSGEVPYCDCGGVIKPDVVFFGESLPQEALFSAARAASSADLCMVFGSSLVVQPAASLPLYTVDAGGKLVILNIGETPLDRIAHKKFEFPVEKISEEVLKLLG